MNAKLPTIKIFGGVAYRVSREKVTGKVRGWKTCREEPDLDKEGSKVGAEAV